MKKVLLSCSLLMGVLFSNAQQELPATFNFDNGTMPVGWAASGFVPGAYQYSAGPSNCITAQGLILSTIRESGSTTLITNAFQNIQSSSLVTVGFDLRVLNSLNSCANLVAFACNTVATVYLVNTDFQGTGVPPANVIYGQRSVELRANMENSVAISVDDNFTGFRNFRVYIIAETRSCPGGQTPIHYVLDNFRVLESPEAPLPVNFKAFSAERSGSKVSLKWTTATEQNNRGFNVQRKVGSDWQTIAFVPSSSNGGNSSLDLSYEMQDVNNEKGISQYRIQQLDFDGKSTFSIIRAVTGLGQASRIVVYPNPSNGVFSVMLNDSEAKDIQVTDMSGRIVSRFNNVINNVEIKGLKTGMYTIQVVDRLSGTKNMLKAVVQ